MTLGEDFRALSPAQRRAVHEDVVRQALARWTAGLGEDVDDWTIVNQAGSSDPDESRWANTLQRAIAAARGR